MPIIYTDKKDKYKSNLIRMLNLNHTRRLISEIEKGLNIIEYLKGYEKGIQQNLEGAVVCLRNYEDISSYRKGYYNGIKTANLIMGTI